LRENQDQILDQARIEESLLSKRLLAYEKRFNDFKRKIAEERQNDRKLVEREKQWAQKVAELRAELRKQREET